MSDPGDILRMNNDRLPRNMCEAEDRRTARMIPPDWLCNCQRLDMVCKLPIPELVAALEAGIISLPWGSFPVTHVSCVRPDTRQAKSKKR